MKPLPSLILGSALLIGSCAKDGEDGAQGPPGNANVQSTTVTISNWTYQDPSWRGDVVWAGITQDIVNSGAVHVYLSNGGGGYEALPITLYPSTAYESNYSAVHYLNGLTIWKTDSDLTQPANPGTRTFKLVAVANSGMMLQDGVDPRDYDAVSRYYGLD